MKLIIFPKNDYSYLKRSDLIAYLGDNDIEVLIEDSFRGGCNGEIGCFGNLRDCRDYIENNNVKGKNFLVYCHEPRFDLSRSGYYCFNTNKIVVMNCYTGDVYCNNLFDVRSDHISSVKDSADALKSKMEKYAVSISQLSSYHQWMIDQSIDEDLIAYRNSIGIFGSRFENFTLMGRGWPHDVKVLGNTREGNWIDTKKPILNNSYFNVCFENTLIKYYVTEKIWDAISSLNVPIYFGSYWIYELLPKGSFIDASLFTSEMELLEYVNSIRCEEWFDRMNLCLESLGKISMQDVHKSKISRFDNIINNLSILM